MKYISYTIAAFMTLAMILIFINMEQWMSLSVQLPFMKVDPWLSGGEVTDTIVGENYKIMVHEAVYKGLFKEDRDGYVQIDVNGDYDGEITICGSNYTINSGKDEIHLLKTETKEEIDVKKCKIEEGWIMRVSL